MEAGMASLAPEGADDHPSLIPPLQKKYDQRSIDEYVAKYYNNHPGSYVTFHAAMENVAANKASSKASSMMAIPYRGRYRCGRCGQLKVKHNCSLFGQVIVSHSSTQTSRIDNIVDVLTGEPHDGEVYLSVSAAPYIPFVKPTEVYSEANESESEAVPGLSSQASSSSSMNDKQAMMMKLYAHHQQQQQHYLSQRQSGIEGPTPSESSARSQGMLPSYVYNNGGSYSYPFPPGLMPMMTSYYPMSYMYGNNQFDPVRGAKPLQDLILQQSQYNSSPFHSLRGDQNGLKDSS